MVRTQMKMASSDDQIAYPTRLRASAALSSRFCTKVRPFPGQVLPERLAECTGRIERYFIDSLKEHDITVERGVMPEAIHLDESVDPADRTAYPVTVTLRHLTEDQAMPAECRTHGSGVQSGLFRSNLAKDDTDDILNAAKANPRAGSTEVVHAKYLIGCDGAHSWVRRQLGFAMEGEQTDYIW